MIGISAQAESKKFASIGLGNYESENYKNGFEFSSYMGFKNEISKKYLSIETNFFEKDDIELSLLNLSINYDYLYKYNNFNPYLGGGINYISIDKLNTSTKLEQNDSKIGFNLKAGLLFEINNIFSINTGIKYININHNLINNTYGGFINFEFNR
jgi:opacity protein-like surface antigen